jgi:hypothetical protein
MLSSTEYQQCAEAFLFGAAELAVRGRHSTLARWATILVPTVYTIQNMVSALLCFWGGRLHDQNGRPLPEYYVMCLHGRGGSSFTPYHYGNGPGAVKCGA